MNDDIWKNIFIDPRLLDCRDAAHAIVSVVTCSLCGCLITDTETHKDMHYRHGHEGYGFKNG